MFADENLVATKNRTVSYNACGPAKAIEQLVGSNYVFYFGWIYGWIQISSRWTCYELMRSTSCLLPASHELAGEGGSARICANWRSSSFSFIRLQAEGLEDVLECLSPGHCGCSTTRALISINDNGWAVVSRNLGFGWLDVCLWCSTGHVSTRPTAVPEADWRPVVLFDHPDGPHEEGMRPSGPWFEKLARTVLVILKVDVSHSQAFPWPGSEMVLLQGTINSVRPITATNVHSCGQPFLASRPSPHLAAYQPRWSEIRLVPFGPLAHAIRKMIKVSLILVNVPIPPQNLKEDGKPFYGETDICVRGRRFHGNLVLTRSVRSQLRRGVGWGCVACKVATLVAIFCFSLYGLLRRAKIRGHSVLLFVITDPSGRIVVGLPRHSNKPTRSMRSHAAIYRVFPTRDHLPSPDPHRLIPPAT